MKINPKQKLLDNYFYNNLLIITCIFSMLFLITAPYVKNIHLNAHRSAVHQNKFTFGPINVKNTPLIYEIKANFTGTNISTEITGEVIKDGNVLYEFSKEMWHESGYDSEGYWSESDRNMSSMLTLKQPGRYFINFETPYNNADKLHLLVIQRKLSGIPHTMIGTYLLLITIFGFIYLNKTWTKEKASELLEAMADS